MSITPLDLQNSVMRTPDAQKHMNSRNDTNQSTGVANPEIVEKKMREDQQNVQETNHAEEERKTSKKEEDNKKNIALRKKGKRNHEDEEPDEDELKEAKDGFRGNFIDIKIF